MKIKTFKQFLAEFGNRIDREDKNSLNQRLKQIDQEIQALKRRTAGPLNAKLQAKAKAKRTALLSKLGQLHYRYGAKNH